MILYPSLINETTRIHLHIGRYSLSVNNLWYINPIIQLHNYMICYEYNIRVITYGKTKLKAYIIDLFLFNMKKIIKLINFDIIFHVAINLRLNSK